MLKEEKILRPSNFLISNGKIIKRIGHTILGFYDGDNDVIINIRPEDVIREIDDKEYYYSEFKSSGSFSDGHSYFCEDEVHGVFLAFDIDESLYEINKEIYNKNGWIHEDELKKEIKKYLSKEHLMVSRYGRPTNIEICDEGFIYIVIPNKILTDNLISKCDNIRSIISEYYDRKYYNKNAKKKALMPEN